MEPITRSGCDAINAQAMNLQDHIVCAIPARQEDIIRKQDEGRSFAERGDLDASRARDVRRLRNVAEVSEHHHSEETLFTKRSFNFAQLSDSVSLSCISLTQRKDSINFHRRCSSAVSLGPSTLVIHSRARRSPTNRIQPHSYVDNRSIGRHGSPSCVHLRTSQSSTSPRVS
jgi:hypothetical protein